MSIIVSIVEDNPIYRQALINIINESDTFCLGGVYGCAETAMEMAANPPHIALVDIQLPGKSGIELIKNLGRLCVATQFLVCSMHDEDAQIVQALEAGAGGYIVKESSAAAIHDALLEIKNGGAPMSPYIAKRVISFFQKPPVQAPDALLSIREKEVLHLLARGLQYKEIAGHLGISYETVKKHLKNIYQKLHVQNKIEALNKLRLL